MNKTVSALAGLLLAFLMTPVFGASIDIRSDKMGPDEIRTLNDNMRRIEAKIQSVAAASTTVSGDITVEDITADSLTADTVTVTTITADVLLAPYPYMQVRDEKSQGTNGGTSATGSFFARTLNTVATNTISGASLTSSSVTLPSGTYYVRWRAPFGGVYEFTTRLRNTTDSSTTLRGSTGYGFGGAGGTDVYTNSFSFGEGVFTITASKTFAVQYQCTSAQATTGLGIDANFATEVYTVLEIWRIK